MGLQDDNPELFAAINTLKAKGFLFEDRDKNACQVLRANQPMVRKILAYDDCRLDVMPDYKMVKIGFEDEPDEEEENLLRAKLSRDALAAFAACYTIYTAKYVSAGLFVATTIPEIEKQMYQLNLSFPGGGRGRGTLRNALRELKKYSIVRFREPSDDTVTITPAINVALHKTGVNRFYDKNVRPWLRETMQKGKRREE